ncbi:hypothetical protein MRB53_038298 [Persea americana]|nr:hypothetical protein MRB53_038298 [Persea americana]
MVERLICPISLAAIFERGVVLCCFCGRESLVGDVISGQCPPCTHWRRSCSVSTARRLQRTGESVRKLAESGSPCDLPLSEASAGESQLSSCPALWLSGPIPGARRCGVDPADERLVLQTKSPSAGFVSSPNRSGASSCPCGPQAPSHSSLSLGPAIVVGVRGEDLGAAQDAGREDLVIVAHALQSEFRTVMRDQESPVGLPKCRHVDNVRRRGCVGPPSRLSRDYLERLEEITNKAKARAARAKVAHSHEHHRRIAAGSEATSWQGKSISSSHASRARKVKAFDLSPSHASGGGDVMNGWYMCFSPADLRECMSGRRIPITPSHGESCKGRLARSTLPIDGTGGSLDSSAALVAGHSASTASRRMPGEAVDEAGAQTDCTAPPAQLPSRTIAQLLVECWP